MPIADTKKAQTIRNQWFTKVATPILNAADVVAAIREAITTHSLAGQFSAGELTAMQDVEAALITLAALPGVMVVELKVVASHRGYAITITGVND